MYFLLLGVKNAWRNIGRSGIAVLSMALACAFLTYSVSLGRGYSTGLYAAHQALTGGEISVYATLFDVGGLDSTAAVHYRQLSSSPLTDLAMFQPECFDPGFITLTEHQDRFASSLIADLAEQPGVKAVYPRYQFPVMRFREDTEDASLDVIAEFALRGRDADLDALQHQSPDALISQGRWFNAEDEGELVCILSQHPKPAPGFVFTSAVGQSVQIYLPRISKNASGEYI